MKKLIELPCKGRCGRTLTTTVNRQNQGVLCDDCRKAAWREKSKTYKKNSPAYTKKAQTDREDKFWAVIVFVPDHYQDCGIYPGDRMPWYQFIDAYPRHVKRNGKRLGWYEGCVVEKYNGGILMSTWRVIGCKIEQIESASPFVPVPQPCQATVITGVNHEHLCGPVMAQKVG